jgi:hypothetical protein
MMIDPDEYPQVKRHAGDRVTQRRPSGPLRVPGRSINSAGVKLTHMSGDLRSITLFADANYFSAA